MPCLIFRNHTFAVECCWSDASDGRSKVFHIFIGSDIPQLIAHAHPSGHFNGSSQCKASMQSAWGKPMLVHISLQIIPSSYTQQPKNGPKYVVWGRRCYIYMYILYIYIYQKNIYRHYKSMCTHTHTHTHTYIHMYINDIYIYQNTWNFTSNDAWLSLVLSMFHPQR